MKKFQLILVAFYLSISAWAQNSGDTTDRRLHDSLLDHLVGEWEVKSVAHGFSSTAVIYAEWILNHQQMHVHFKGNEVIPWIGIPMEFDYFIGYNHDYKRYIIHGISVFGNDEGDGFWYAYRSGNELKLIQHAIISSPSDTFNVQQFIWQPETSTWIIQSKPEINGKEGEVFLNMNLTAVKPKRK